MAEPPSHEELARRWLALWQDQFVAKATDSLHGAAPVVKEGFDDFMSQWKLTNPPK